MGRAGVPLRGPEGGSPPDGGAGLAREEEPPRKRSFVTRREFLTVERELEQVQAELKCLRWQVRQMGSGGGGGEGAPLRAEEPRRYNGHTWTELRAMVQRERDPHQAARTILTALSGDPPALCKPLIDPELYMVHCAILQSVFPGLRGEKEAAAGQAERDSRGSPGNSGPWRETSPVLEMFQEPLCGAGPSQPGGEGSLA